MWMWLGLQQALGGPGAPDGVALMRSAERLSTVGSVLYVAAHPDDENTRLIAYLVGDRGLDVTYLSLTRGGGGQNLVGDQMSERLGVVRTGELLAARAIDGGAQRFTRARDFGYSKSSEEALSSWGHDEVLADVVRVIREVKPDVVITRFGPTDRTHGHHTASAILAAEAVEKAADPTYSTEGQSPWVVDRILRNESGWRITEDTDTSNWSSIDVGTFDPARGVSWGEVAAAARTMHKSQGFGSAPRVGEQLEYFSAVAGNTQPVDRDPLAGLDTTWARFDDTKGLRKALAKLEVDPARPAASLKQMAGVHDALVGLPGAGAVGLWRDRKHEALEQWLVDASGFWFTAHTEASQVAPGQTVPIALNGLFRTGEGRIDAVALVVDGDVVPSSRFESAGTALESTVELTIPADAATSRPHWLVEPPTATLYTLPDGPTRTLAETAPSIEVELDLNIGGVPLTVRQPVLHAWTDRVHGQLTHPLEILPPVTATFERSVRYVAQGETVTMALVLRGDGASREGLLSLQAPEGWQVSPAELSFQLDAERLEQIVPIEITPGDTTGSVSATVEVDGQRTSFGREGIDLPHLPRRTLLEPAELTLVPVDLQRGEAGRVGYIEGSGDVVRRTLSDLGYEVVEIDEDAILDGSIASVDTLIVGIRAFNVRPRLHELRGSLHDWVAQGGRLIVQYHTSSSRRPLDDLGPFPLTIRRDRVTDQTAAMVPIDPEASLLTAPNALGPEDWEGWVQERGLYFGQRWDDRYRPVFRMNDPGEDPLEGSLLVAAHGDGVFVYTGLSFFRQFPSGVPGAARLFANLLAAKPE